MSIPITPDDIKAVVSLTPPDSKHLLARVKILLYDEELIIDGWTISKSIKIDSRFQDSIWIQSPRLKLPNGFWLKIVSIIDKRAREMIEEKIYDVYHKLIIEKKVWTKNIEDLSTTSSKEE